MTTVFVLQHLHTLPSQEEDLKLLGVYGSREDAEAALARFRRLPGFSTFPALRSPLEDECETDGFYISDIQVGLDYWPEGFVTV